MTLLNFFKRFKSLSLSIFTVLMLLVGSFSNSFAHAQEVTAYKYGDMTRVTADKLNIRNKDCQIKKTIGKSSILFIAGQAKDIADNTVYPETVYCTVNNESYLLHQVMLPNSDALGLYVAYNFIEYAGLNPLAFEDRAQFRLSTSNVNIRNENCERRATLDTREYTFLSERTKPLIFCTINSVNYMLVPVTLINKLPSGPGSAYIASDFLIKN